MPPFPRIFFPVSYLPSIPFPNGAAPAAAKTTVAPARRAGPHTPERAELTALVNRARAGDLGAQSELVRRYTRRLSAFVRPIIAQPSAVEDIVQMAFIKMVRRLGQMRDPVTFEAWLFTLARNTAVDFIRRRRCRPTTVPDEGYAAATPAIDSGRTIPEIIEALDHALDHLKPKDRHLVTMIVQGASYRDAAQRTGVSISAVKVRLNRVRPFLRASVGEAIGLRSTAAESVLLPSRNQTAA